MYIPLVVISLPGCLPFRMNSEQLREVEPAAAVQQVLGGYVSWKRQRGEAFLFFPQRRSYMFWKVFKKGGVTTNMRCFHGKGYFGEISRSSKVTTNKKNIWRWNFGIWRTLAEGGSGLQLVDPLKFSRNAPQDCFFYRSNHCCSWIQH